MKKSTETTRHPTMTRREFLEYLADLGLLGFIKYLFPSISILLQSCEFKRTVEGEMNILLKTLRYYYNRYKNRGEFSPLTSLAIEGASEKFQSDINEYLKKLGEIVKQMEKFNNETDKEGAKQNYPDLFHPFVVYDNRGNAVKILTYNFGENQNPDLNITLHHIVHRTLPQSKDVSVIDSISLANLLQTQRQETNIDNTDNEKLRKQIIQTIKTMVLFYAENIIEIDNGQHILPAYRVKNFGRITSHHYLEAHNRAIETGEFDQIMKKATITKGRRPLTLIEKIKLFTDKHPVLYPMDNFRSLYHFLFYAHTVWNDLKEDEIEKVIDVVQKTYNFWEHQVSSFADFLARYYSLTGIRLTDSVAPDDTIANPVGYMINIARLLENMGNEDLADKYRKLAKNLLINCEEAFWIEGYIYNKQKCHKVGMLIGSTAIGNYLNESDETKNPDRHPFSRKNEIDIFALNKKITQDKQSFNLPADGTRIISARCEVIADMCNQHNKIKDKNKKISEELKENLELLLDHALKEWKTYLYLFEQKQIYLGVWKEEGLKLIKKEDLDNNKRELFEEIGGKYIGTNGYITQKEGGIFEVKRWLGKNEDAFTHREVYKGATAILWLYQNYFETLKSILGNDHELIKNLEEIIFPSLDFLERYIKEIHNILLYNSTKNKDKNTLYQRFIGVIDPILKSILGIKGKLNFEKSHQFSQFLNQTTVRNNSRKL